MIRVLSGAALLILAIAVVWLAPPPVFLAVAELLLVLGFVEYARLAAAGGLAVPAIPAGAAAMLTCAAFARLPFAGFSPAPLDVVLMSALVALGALTLTSWRGGPDALGVAAASLFPSLYLGLPLGAMIAIRGTRGPEALFLLMLTVIVSDTAQYYRPRIRAPRAGADDQSEKDHRRRRRWLPLRGGGAGGGRRLVASERVSRLASRGLGVTVVALGIAGDLFESMLKRSAGVKDSSA